MGIASAGDAHEVLSNSQIDKIGAKLRTGDVDADYLRKLEDFRDMYVRAYRHVEDMLENKMGVPITGRPSKSTVAIIEKLKRETIRLNQIQDIAGCRVLVGGLFEQDNLVEALLILFTNVEVDDKRRTPTNGYRAVHVIVWHNGRPVEIQVRTGLQHAWAEISEKIADDHGHEIKYRKQKRQGSFLSQVALVLREGRVRGGFLRLTPACSPIQVMQSFDGHRGGGVMHSAVGKINGVLLAVVLCLAPFQAEAQAVAVDTQQVGASAQEQEQQGAGSDQSSQEAEVPAVSGGDQETMLYLIRERKFVGGARGVWVAANDKVVADLDSGTHVLLGLKPGLNTINIVQGKAGFAYTTIDHRAGDTAYLVMDYKAGTLTEVPPDQGAALVKATKEKTALAEPRHNDGYDNLLINPALLGFGMIAENVQPIAPDEQSAVISFYRPARLIAPIPFSVWNKEG